MLRHRTVRCTWLQVTMALFHHVLWFSFSLPVLSCSCSFSFHLLALIQLELLSVTCHLWTILYGHIRHEFLFRAKDNDLSYGGAETRHSYSSHLIYACTTVHCTDMYATFEKPAVKPGTSNVPSQAVPQIWFTSPTEYVHWQIWKNMDYS